MTLWAHPKLGPVVLLKPQAAVASMDDQAYFGCGQVWAETSGEVSHPHLSLLCDSAALLRGRHLGQNGILTHV